MHPTHLTRSLVGGLFLLATTVAHAGTVDAQGVWSPAGCGARPEAPAVDGKNADTFNRSVDAINAYRQRYRSYLDCLTREANADVQALLKAAQAAQQSAQAAGLQANAKIDVDVKAASDKLAPQ